MSARSGAAWLITVATTLAAHVCGVALPSEIWPTSLNA